MVCEEKAIPYELKLIDAQATEVRAIHPFGKIPVMRHGDFTLCESKAIATTSRFRDRACFRPSRAMRR
jgi:glutathione S-transferase